MDGTEETLRARLARNPGGLDADEALRMADGLLAALAAVHAAGRVQRILTSANVLLGRDGSVRLADADDRPDHPAPEFADPSFRGTPASDVFAAGVVLHEALTGAAPYDAEGELHVRVSVRRVLSQADEVLRTALAADPSARYSDAAAFRAALGRVGFREIRSETDTYRILRLVGEGGFGCVYKARALDANRFVAVKQLKRPEYGDRFRREAHVMKKLDDPSFVRLVDYFETNEFGGTGAFLVMDYLPGMPGNSLRDAIRRAEGGRLPFADVLQAFERYARALGRLHQLGIYHRDIKPSNLYFPQGDPSRAAIMDLGIARDTNGTATQGQVPGTLDYMPPEVVFGESRGDAGMDLYALGLCLYEAVSGQTGYPRLPSGVQAFPAFYERVKSRCPPAFDAPCVRDRPKLLKLLQAMTALDPKKRLQDAEVLRRRLMDISADLSDEVSATAPPAGPETAVEPESNVEPPTDAGPATDELSDGAGEWGRWRRGLLIAGCALGLLATAGGARILILRGIARFRSRESTVTVEQMTPAATPAAASSVTEVAELPQTDPTPEATAEQRELLGVLADTRVTVDECHARISAWKSKWRGAIDPATYSALERKLFEAEIARKNRALPSPTPAPTTTSTPTPAPSPSNAIPKQPPRVDAFVSNASNGNSSLRSDAIETIASTCCETASPAKARETKAVLAAYPKGVRCWVDDVECAPGELRLQRGLHVVRYSRAEETHPGVKDYLPKEYEFETQLSRAVSVPAPLGEWRQNPEFTRAQDEARLAARGREIERKCRRLIDPQPIETRRRRLEEAHALLSDWQTASALAAVGADVEKSLRAEYAAERARIRGYVKNATALAARVTTDGASVAVPPGARTLVTFERRWPEDARAVVPGYEFVMLPREASAFDGLTFEIASNRLVKVGVWENSKKNGKRSFFDSFRDTVDDTRRWEIGELERAIELRKKLERGGLETKR